MIHLISAWRRTREITDADRLQFSRYFLQVASLRNHGPLRVHNVYGDSVRELPMELRQAAEALDEPVELYEYSHGTPDHGSCELPERLTALSGLLNAALDAAAPQMAADDIAIWVESDLYWDAFTLLQLQRFLRRPEVDIVAPMIFAGEPFYDTWGFRTTDGRRWGPFWPWGLIEDFTQPSVLVEMGSVGSVVAMTAQVAQTVRVRDGMALAGWCGEARRIGLRVWCAKDLRVQHPFDLAR